MALEKEGSSVVMDKIALTLLVIGGINWGCVGLFQFDLVAFASGGSASLISRIVYTLVGLSAVVKVDTSDTSGRLLAASARTEPVPGDLVSQAPAVDFAPVEATISGIIRDNALPGVCPVQGKP